MKRLLAALFILLAILPPAAAQKPGLTIFAAASLTDAMTDIATLWQARGHARPVLSFESSSTLAKQIIAGAPADLFASADEKWMDAVANAGKLVPRTRIDLLGNSLVLVARRGALRPVTLRPGFDINAILGPTGRLAVGDPAHVPAGIYAQQALESLQVWPQVRDRLAPAENVRAALLLVERGEAPAGIVYATDAGVSKTLAIAGTFPPSSHEPIRYPFALVRHGEAREARAFLAFLRTQPAQDVFAHYGFSPP